MCSRVFCFVFLGVNDLFLFKFNLLLFFVFGLNELSLVLTSNCYLWYSGCILTIFFLSLLRDTFFWKLLVWVSFFNDKSLFDLALNFVL